MSPFSAERFVTRIGALAPAGWAAGFPGADLPAWDSAFAEVHLDSGRVDLLLGQARPMAGPWSSEPAWRAWRDEPIFWFEWDRAGTGWGAPLCWYGLSGTPRGLPSSPRAEVIRRLHGLPRAIPLVEALDAGELLHVGSLAPRGLDRTRLAFSIPARRVAPWLRRIRWPGDPAAVARALFAVSAPDVSVGVQVELQPDVGAYLGIECRELRESGEAEEYVAAVRRLAPSRMDPGPALATWPGHDESGERVGYLKLVRSAGGWTTKLYLGFTRAGLA